MDKDDHDQDDLHDEEDGDYFGADDDYRDNIMMGLIIICVTRDATNIWSSLTSELSNTVLAKIIAHFIQQIHKYEY